MKGLGILGFNCVRKSHCHIDKLDDYIPIYIHIIQLLRDRYSSPWIIGECIGQ